MKKEIKLFRTILCDPPWPYRIRGPASSKDHRPNSHGAAPSSVERYGGLSIPQISSIRVPSEQNAHLYLWMTNGFLVEAHEVARAWGFEPKTAITWVKTKHDGTPSMKTGFYFRGATEHILFCVKGSLRLSGPASPTVFYHKRLPHSQKPDCVYELIEKNSPGPRLEMFARTTRDGWDRWGNQVENTVDLEQRKVTTFNATGYPVFT